MPMTDAELRAAQRAASARASNNSLMGRVFGKVAAAHGGELAHRAGVAAEQKAQRARELEEFDAESGKFYNLMREGFRQRTQGLSSGALTTGLGAVNQSAARRGISFSGLEQAAQANLQGQVGAAQLQAESQYDQRLNELRQTSRDAFIQGQFDYFHELQRMSYAADLEKELSSFQAELADRYSSGWQNFFGAIGQGIGMFAGGGFGALGGALGGLFGGGNQSGFVGPQGPRQYPYE